ncbi:hypothetical protein [Oleiagrimonas soli]|uniref:Uncharacterized protein n=1 Tax=Oleiagrimonas soli TaxID=1543381 RepID=A0A099CYM6_9GAMM|nr:hypothetical protein [Oleiagrimonas soli]KGI78854.1 hypothetical protein LF63_0102685 [Oleiagrimonas soli]MBB6184348.1 hypothetical protein [Oleiagrimonas soli]
MDTGNDKKRARTPSITSHDGPFGTRLSPPNKKSRGREPDTTPTFGGALHPMSLPVVHTLQEAQDASKSGQVFGLRPHGGSFTTYQGMATHVTSTEGTSWTQQFAKPSSRLSSKYEKLFPRIDHISDLTRANKALVSGQAGQNRYGKALSKPAQMTASLLRINEASTAFGSDAMGMDGKDVGAGMMADVLGQKWAHKNSHRGRRKRTRLGGDEVLSELKGRYPQLDTTSKMRDQGEDALLRQVGKSRTFAAEQAMARGKAKGLDGDGLEDYVRGKFAKHGLGEVPDLSGFRSSAKRDREDDEDHDRQAYTGGFAKTPTKRMRSLEQSRRSMREYAKGMSSPFVRPGGSKSGVFEGFKSQVAPSKGTMWEQWKLTAPDTSSTKYTELFKSMSTLSDLGRANKALVKGGSDMLSPTPGESLWRGKSYSSEAQATATLLRLNEPHTALGGSSMGSERHDAGTGIMAETLAIKWKNSSNQQHLNKQDRTPVAPSKALGRLEARYPQLDNVDKLRVQGQSGLTDQIASSRMKAAVQAGRRGLAKGQPDHSLSEYVQHKFNKHGLGQVPGGWKRQLTTPKPKK